MTAKVSMICTKQSNGSYFALCPEIKGCFTQGDTYEEAFANLKELVEVTVNEGLEEEELQGVLSSKIKIFSEFEIEISGV